MKWNKIPEKEPEFEMLLVLWLENDTWGNGKLREIRSNGDGKQFIFLNDEGEQIPIKATHWGIPTKPKE